MSKFEVLAITVMTLVITCIGGFCFANNMRFNTVENSEGEVIYYEDIHGDGHFRMDLPEDYDEEYVWVPVYFSEE